MITSRIAAAAMAAVFTLAPLAIAGPAQADSSNPQGANFGKLFYDGTVVRTVVTPTSTPGKGVDPIYPIMGGVDGQMPVTAAAPGDNYHGGRWAVNVVTWDVAPYLLTSDEAVLAAAEAGHVTITRMPGADFVCPVAGR
ncbi:MAG TPA: hypothetical protein VMX11_03135 [Actinomycetes bacterium]|nr:hypothetical protein [Actinomycetes bacterium]